MMLLVYLLPGYLNAAGMGQMTDLTTSAKHASANKKCIGVKSGKFSGKNPADCYQASIDFDAILQNIINPHTRIENREVFTKLKVGDIIYRKNAWQNIIGDHCLGHTGIYLGDYAVAQIMSLPNKYGSHIYHIEDAIPRQTRLIDFVGQNQIYILNINEAFSDPTIVKNTPEAIKRIALEYINQERTFEPYHVRNNNGQHFVTLCVIGKALSWDLTLVDELLIIGGNILDLLCGRKDGVQVLNKVWNTVLDVTDTFMRWWIRGGA